MKKKSIYFIHEFLFRSWWVFGFAIVCYMLYEQGMRKREMEYNKHYGRVSSLKNDICTAAAVQEDLLLRINSQSDPAWVELTLKRGLGLVSEEQTKVWFK